MKTQDPLPIPKHAKNMTMRDYYAGQALAGAAEAAMRRGAQLDWMMS